MKLLVLLLPACEAPAEPGDPPAPTGDSGEAEDSGDSGDVPVTPTDALVPLDTQNPNGDGVVHINDIALGDDAWVSLACTFGLNTVDGADPAALPRATDRVGQLLYWVERRDDRLLVSGREAGVALVSIGDTGGLRARATLTGEGFHPEGLALTEAHAFVAAQSDGLRILDASDLTEVGVYAGAADAIDVEVAGDTAFVLDRALGLLAVDVSDPAAPALLGSLALDGAAQQVELSGDLAVLAMGNALTVVDVSDPANLVLRSSTVSGGLASRVAVDGDLVAVADWQDLRLYDLADPAAPRLVALEAVRTFANSVAMADGVVWLGDWDELRSFSLDAGARSPELTWRDTRVLYGDAGETITDVVSVTNEGDLDLVVSGASCDAGASVEPSAFTLAPGESTSVTVSVDAGDGRETELACTLSTNDVDEPSARLDLIVNPGGLAVGDLAPDFTLPDLDGAVWTLSDHRGDVVFITLFSTW